MPYSHVDPEEEEEEVVAIVAAAVAAVVAVVAAAATTAVVVVEEEETIHTTHLQAPVVVVVPLDISRPVRLHTVAQSQHEGVLELLGRHAVHAHVARAVEEGCVVAREQHAVDVSHVAVGGAVVESAVEGVVKRRHAACFMR